MKMLKHVVMFKLKEEYLEKPKMELAIEIKEALEKLPNIIPHIKYYEVGINVLTDPRAYDIVLISSFESEEDLKIYRNHPVHKEILSFILERSEDSKVVDFFG